MQITSKVILRSAILGLPISILVFMLYTISAFNLYELKVFNQVNIIFGSDPNAQSIAFADGYGGSIFHPNLSNLINPFVRGVALILKPLFLNLSDSELRMRVSLFVSPFFAALTTYMIYLIATFSTLSFTRALALSLLFGLSISTIGLGSVPDHFLISSFVLSVAVLLIQIDSKLSYKFRFIAWTLLISTIEGITISNTLPALALFTFSERMRQTSWQVTAKQTLKALIIATGLTVALWVLGNFVYHGVFIPLPFHGYEKLERIPNGLTSYPLRDFLSFPFTIGQAFWGGAPDILPIPGTTNPNIAKYNVTFFYDVPIHRFKLQSFVLLLPVMLVGLSLYVGQKYQKQKSLPFIAGTIVFFSFNWLLHSFWQGREFFLFSPHWHFMSVLALIPLCLVYQARVWTSVLVGISLLIAGLNLSVWHNILKLLPNLQLP
jgi:hypothetical protein